MLDIPLITQAAMKYILTSNVLVYLLVPAVTITTFPGLPGGTKTMADLPTLKANGVDSLQPCQFETVDEDFSETLGRKLAISGIKLLRYDISFVNYSRDVMTAAGGDLFRPNLWIRTVNRQGTNLLMFDDNFEVFSIGLLGVGIEDLEVKLTDSPHGCLQNLTASQRIREMRKLLQVDFKVNSTDVVDEVDEQICNMRMYTPNPEVHSGDVAALFTYMCCHSNNHEMECADVEENNWVSTLVEILKVIIVFLVLYSPLFVPRVYYEKKSKENAYVIQFHDKTTVTIDKENKEYFISKPDELIYIDRMSSATSKLESFGGGNYAKFKCQLNDVTISVPDGRLLSEDSSPVAITTMLYENLFQCKLGQTLSLTPCCYSSFFGEIFEERFQKYKISWHECLKVFMKVLLFVFCLIPSIVQYVIYDRNIAPGVKVKHDSIKRINATFIQRGDFEILGLGNQTLHFYSVAIVVISGIALQVYHHFIQRFFTIPNFKTHIRDMENQKFLPILNTILHLCLVPFVKCGIFGVLLFPFYSIIVLLYIGYFLVIMFPLLNLISRLLLYPFLPILASKRRQFLAYFDVKDTIGTSEPGSLIRLEHKFWAAWYPYIAIFIIFITYMLFWVVDCVIFYTKIIFYVCIGVIANSNKTLPYVTVVFLVGIYISQIFGNIGNLYHEYSKIIRNLILSMYTTDLDTMVKQTNTSAASMAFHLEPDDEQDFSSTLSSDASGGPIFFNTKKLLLFIERTKEDQAPVSSGYEIVGADVKESHKVFTPKKMFREALELKGKGSPGPVWKNVLFACARLLIVLAFLTFVVVVVMGLGDTYKISITNQLFLAVAGGLLPLIFRHVVSENANVVSVDGESSDLKININQQLEKYDEEWEVIDMSLTLLQVEEGQGHPEVRTHKDAKVMVNEEGHHPGIEPKPGHSIQDGLDDSCGV